jgi:hypothetical protein
MSIAILQSGRYTAFLATAFLLITSVLSVFLYFGWTGSHYPEFDSRRFKSHLDPLYLKEVWDWRRENFGFILALDFFGALALLMSIYPIFCVKQVVVSLSLLWFLCHFAHSTIDSE